MEEGGEPRVAGSVIVRGEDEGQAATDSRMTYERMIIVRMDEIEIRRVKFQVPK